MRGGWWRARSRRSRRSWESWRLLRRWLRPRRLVPRLLGLPSGEISDGALHGLTDGQSRGLLFERDCSSVRGRARHNVNATMAAGTWTAVRRALAAWSWAV